MELIRNQMKRDGAVTSRLVPLRRALEGLARMTLPERVKKRLQPRLGKLWHHPPRPLRVPPEYSRNPTPSPAPRISIVTPSLNQASFLEHTMRSVVGQGYPNLEYVVQDGGSTDGSLDLLKRWDTHISAWESRSDHGQACALNLGFRKTGGEIMAYLNSDDVLLPGALNYVGEYFLRHPDVDVLYGHRILVDDDHQEIGRWILPPHDKTVIRWADFIPQQTLFWRRRVWEKVGGAIDETFQFAMDWDLILRFDQVGATFVRLPRFLAAFRVHPDQKTTANWDDLGNREVARIRRRCHGRDVTEEEIRDNVWNYLLYHVLIAVLYDGGVLRY